MLYIHRSIPGVRSVFGSAQWLFRRWYSSTIFDDNELPDDGSVVVKAPKDRSVSRFPSKIPYIPPSLSVADIVHEIADELNFPREPENEDLFKLVKTDSSKHAEILFKMKIFDTWGKIFS
ncbi:hypothetical protein ACOME3_000994 [Neoechinorhynchus agilis]